MKRAPATTFKRVASYFEDMSKFRPVDYDSSGSEHSSESSLIDLSDPMNSFTERDLYDEKVTSFSTTESRYRRDDNEVVVVVEDEAAEKGEVSEFDKSSASNSKRRDELDGLLGQNRDDRNVKIILEKTKIALLLLDVVGDSYTLGFKRSLMTRLRETGLDAGLCKSKWEKSGHILAGDHEYIDVNVTGTRYILEVNLAGHFQIARPSSRYAALIEILPSIYVGKVEDLKPIVNLMCTAIKKSMKNNDLLLAPWRRNCYMQLKWFGAYRRTINAVSAKKISVNYDVPHKKKLMIGFETSSCSLEDYCSDQFAGNKNDIVGRNVQV